MVKIKSNKQKLKQRNIHAKETKQNEIKQNTSGHDFLDTTPKAQFINEKNVISWTLFNLKNFCLPKALLREKKTSHRDGEKNLQNTYQVYNWYPKYTTDS